MANIGSFKKVGNDFQGEIVTLSLQAKGVRIVPETNRSNDNAPSHRVFVGRAEIGAAWSKRSNEGRDYLSLKLDDPSFNAPIFANLFDDEDGEGYTLIWSRPQQERRLRAPLQAPPGPPGGASSSGASAPVSGRGWSKRAIRRYRPRFGSPGALRAGAGVFDPAFLVTGRRTGAAIAAAESGSARPVAQSPAATKNWSYMATTAAPPRPSSRPSAMPVICGMTECAL